ncbi:Ig-like domain-containing protein [Streptomyces sp. NPDC054841]
MPSTSDPHGDRVRSRRRYAADGTVTFFDGTTALGTVPLSDGRAVLGIPTLPPGDHSLTAHYSGGATYAESTSPVLVHTVVAGDGWTGHDGSGRCEDRPDHPDPRPDHPDHSDRPDHDHGTGHGSTG